MRVWIDTGHLNAGSGAVGGGQVEVKRNDTLADAVERLAKAQGWAVGSTDENDPKTTLSERVADAANFNADIFVSIHHDWTKGEQAVIYSNTNDDRETKARRLAGYINRRIITANPKIPNGGIYADRRGLAVLKSKMPAVIVEASRVQDSYSNELMARLIVQGIADYRQVPFKDPAGVKIPKTNPQPKKPSPPMLRHGSKGWWVKKLQSILNSKGEKLAVDGDFGPKTLAAVRRFQKNHSLVVDGIVGPKTWAKLNKGPSVKVPQTKPKPTTLRLGSSGSWVRTLQRALNNKGASLAVDGIFGPKTLSAVKNYQKSQKISVDGIVGPVTWGKLGY